MAESPKVETRLGRVMRDALSAYMRDRHLTNESEIMRSLLGQFLEREGYLKTDATTGPAAVREEPPAASDGAAAVKRSVKRSDGEPHEEKRIGFSLKKQKPVTLFIPPNKYDGQQGAKPVKIY